MWRRSITLRLTFYFAIASTLTLLAIGYLVGAAVERHFVELDRSELQGKMELVRHILAQVRTPSDLEGASGRIADALTGHHGLIVRVATPDGRTLFATPGSVFPPELDRARAGGNPQATPGPSSWEQSGETFRGLAGEAAMDAGGFPRVAVTIGISTEAHHKFMVGFYRTLSLAIGLGILSTGLLGWVAARRGLAPVREMTLVAQRVTASRLDDRLPVATLPAELLDLAKAFNEMLSRLEDSFRRLSEFSSDLAHELRTPIANLMTQTQVALSRGRTAEEYREVMYSISEEFDRLARMISDMLFLAKADHGLIVPGSEPVDLASEVRELFEFYDAFAEDRGVGLAFAGEGTVGGDRLMIRRAISNLLSNAINHTAAGGTVAVRIESADAGGVRLCVENPGPGISPEHLSRVFERFYRVDPSRQRMTEGAGLGLAITKSIVAAHRGSVRATSGEGRTTFEFTLPALSPPGPPPIAPM